MHFRAILAGPIWIIRCWCLGLIALCWKLAGQESTDAPIAIAFLFALGTTGVLVGALGALRGKAHALLAGTLLLGTASFIALSAALYGDVPLSFYILATLALLCLQDRYPDDLSLQYAGGLDGRVRRLDQERRRVLRCCSDRGSRGRVVPVSSNAPPSCRSCFASLGGLAAPLAVVITFKLRLAGPSEYLSQPASVILKHLSDIGRWILTVEGLVIVLFNFGRFLIPIILVLALYWYLVRFQVDVRDRAGAGHRRNRARPYTGRAIVGGHSLSGQPAARSQHVVRTHSCFNCGPRRCSCFSWRRVHCNWLRRSPGEGEQKDKKPRAKRCAKPVEPRPAFKLETGASRCIFYGTRAKRSAARNNS